MPTDNEIKEQLIIAITHDPDVLVLVNKFCNGDPNDLFKNPNSYKGLSGLLNLVCQMLKQGYSQEYLVTYFKYRLFLVECMKRLVDKFNNQLQVYDANHAQMLKLSGYSVDINETTLYFCDLKNLTSSLTQVYIMPLPLGDREFLYKEKPLYWCVSVDRDMPSLGKNHTGVYKIVDINQTFFEDLLGRKV